MTMTSTTTEVRQRKGLRQHGQAMMRSSNQELVFVVVRMPPVGIFGSFFTRFGPMSHDDAYVLANYFMDASGAGRPRIVKRTKAEPSEHGWCGSDSDPPVIQRILAEENARIEARKDGAD